LLKIDFKKIFGNKIINYNCKIDNIFFNKENDKNIINELYVYYVLNLLSLDINKDILYTNIYLLNNFISLHEKERNNISAIYTAIKGLKESGFIIYEYDEKIYVKEKQYNPMVIRFLKRDPPSNYTLLYHWMYEKSNDPKEFFVFAYIQKWKNSTYKISTNEWIKKMGYTKRVVMELLKKMQDENKIKIVSGKYESGEQSKNINSYVIVEDEYKTVLGDLTLDEIKEMIQECNWGKVNEFGHYETLTQWDFDLYMVCREFGVFGEFVDKCEDVLRKMKMYPGGIEKIKRFEKEYLRQVEVLK